MAVIRQRDSGWFQAIIRRKSHPLQSKTFRTRSAAREWARALESEIDRGVFVLRAVAERTTLREIAERYRREVLPSKRGAEREGYRLDMLLETFGDYALAAITPAMIAAHRDRRLAAGLSAQSVVHDLSLMSRIFRTAVMDWGIALPGGVPTALVRKPSVRNERSRRLVSDEEARLLAAMDKPGRGRKGNPWLKPLARLAVETAARRSELLSLQWNDVDLERVVARVRRAGGRETKNKDAYRDVPLSKAAVAILEGLAAKHAKVTRLRRGAVFPTTELAVKQAWARAVRRARDGYERETLTRELRVTGLSETRIAAEVRRAKPMGGRKSHKAASRATQAVLARLSNDPLLRDLHFHDLRHEATSRLAERLAMHELMKVTGHKGTRMLARYYHPRAEDLAKKLG